MTIEISKVKIKIKDVEIEVTLDELKELKNQLNVIFQDNTIITYPYIPTIYPLDTIITSGCATITGCSTNLGEI